MSLPPEAAIAHVIVGVADMAPVRELWCERFGLEVLAERGRSDPALAALWGLPADGIREQLVLRTPGEESGLLHVVCFTMPAEPVRRGAGPTASCPKNIDVNCRDMDARVAELTQAGFSFRSAISDFTIGEVSAREVQMPAHDDTNVVFIEVHGWPPRLSPREYGAVTSLVLTVPDTTAESRFFCELFGMQSLIEERITGASIEKAAGLPPGAALDLRLLGLQENLYGRVELVCYEGASGANLYPRARPPATGTLGCRLRVANADALLANAAHLGYAAHDGGAADTVFGRCRIVQLASPAGCLVEAYEAM